MILNPPTVKAILPLLFLISLKLWCLPSTVDRKYGQENARLESAQTS